MYNVLSNINLEPSQSMPCSFHPIFFRIVFFSIFFLLIKFFAHLTFAFLQVHHFALMVATEECQKKYRLCSPSTDPLESRNFNPIFKDFLDIISNASAKPTADEADKLKERARAVLRGDWCVLCEQRHRRNESRKDHLLGHWKEMSKAAYRNKYPKDAKELRNSGDNLDQFFADVVEPTLKGSCREKKALRDLRDMLGIRPAASASAAPDSPKKRESSPVAIECEYCDERSPDPSRALRHLSLDHFQEAILKEVPLPTTPAQGQGDDIRCPRCEYQALSREDLVIHLADYHKMLQRIQSGAGTNGSGGDVSAGGSLEALYSDLVAALGPGLIGCVMCGTVFEQRHKALNHALEAHLAPMVRALMPPANEPAICSLCFYECSSLLSLRRHLVSLHVEQIKAELHKLEHPKFKRKLTPGRGAAGMAREVAGPPKKEVRRQDRTLIRAKRSYKEAGKSGESDGETSVKNAAKAVSAKDFFDMARRVEASGGGEEEDEDERPLELQELLRCQQEPKTRAPRLVLPSTADPATSEWLCDGRLLLLHEAETAEARALFQSQWLRGQPVVLRGSARHLDPELWTPKAFNRDFGKLRHNLINCLNGNVVPKALLKKFWDGFERLSARLKSADGRPMLLKLKDWPPSSDIADFMPSRFKNLERAFPMPEYTLR